MEPPKSYCKVVVRMDKTNVHRIYHDQAYGFPIGDDNELFGAPGPRDQPGRIELEPPS